jgi:hypothetical protein
MLEEKEGTQTKLHRTNSMKPKKKIAIGHIFINKCHRSKTLHLNNGGEWVVDFDQLCKNYGIIRQYIMLQWPKYNGMVERLVKTLKHGLIVLFATSKHIQN